MNTRPFLIVFVSTFAVIIVSSVIGNILESKGTLDELGPNAVTTMMVFYFTLFLVLCFSLVPLILRFFISMQIKIGNADFFMVKWIKAHEKGIVYGFWIFCITGLLISLPAAIKDGFFTP